jgi:hypothetical protein
MTLFYLLNHARKLLDIAGTDGDAIFRPWGTSAPSRAAILAGLGAQLM